MDNLISNSSVMTSQALNDLQRVYFEYVKLLSDVRQAEDAGLPVVQSSKQIQERMDGVKKIINVYSTTPFNP